MFLNYQNIIQQPFKSDENGPFMQIKQVRITSFWRVNASQGRVPQDAGINTRVVVAGGQEVVVGSRRGMVTEKGMKNGANSRLTAAGVERNPTFLRPFHLKDP